MKKTWIILILLGGLTALFAMGQKPAGAMTATTGMDFTLDRVEELTASSDWQLTVEQGSEAKVHIAHGGDRKGWVYYNGEQLRFGVEPRVGLNLDFKPHRATVTLPGLPSRMEASSSSSIESDFSAGPEELFLDASSSGRISLGRVRTNRAVFKASSSGRIDGEELDCEVLKLDLSSSAKVTLEGGSAGELFTEISSSAGFYGEDFLVTESFKIKGSSSSKQEFRIADDVEASGDLSASSLLILHGDPPARVIQDIRTSSSARVKVE